MYRVGDWVFVSVLLAIALTGFLLEGVRIAMDHPGYSGTQFVGWVFAQPLAGVSTTTLGGLRHGLWWFHGLLAITFVASIPYTKAGHMLTSLASLLLRDPLAGKRLAPIPGERAGDRAGYGALADFSSLHLLQLDACTKCGRCQWRPARPTPPNARYRCREIWSWNCANKPTVRWQAMARVACSVPCCRAGRDWDGGFAAGVIGPNRVRVETVWSCMQCNACVEICPVGIEQAPIINQLRRRLVDDGELDANLASILQAIHRSGNSFAENRRKRGRWTTDLDFDVKDARDEPVEVLWFVGDYASFDPRSQRVTRSVARLLHEAHVDFGILYDGEANSGNDVRRVGEEGLFESLAEHNIATLAKCRFKRILTTDPHSLNTLRNEYPALGGSWDVVHHTTLLLELIDDGPARGLGKARVPCHLPRPLSSRPHEQRVRGSTRHSLAPRLHAHRNAPKPRQLVLLWSRRRADLDP